jgi:hypothetical protein
MTDLFGQKKIYAANNVGNAPCLNMSSSAYFGWRDFILSEVRRDDKTHAWMNEVVLGGKDG